MTTLEFYGAAETVTGSKYLLEADGAKVLVDCGLFQGLKKLRELNWKPPGFSARSVDAVVLTHAHLDHVGYLPRLVKEGYRNSIFSTPATEELARLILLDSAVNQERDAEYANRKKFSKHKPALPLYTGEDAEKTMRMFRTVKRGKWFSPAEPVWVRMHDAGHLLGSSMLEVEVRNQDPPLRILFSGDVGRYDAPLYHDPEPPTPCDVLVCESTYGDRDHPESDLMEGLAEAVNGAARRGGVMLVASFSVGRAQQFIYMLQLLIHAKRVPRIPVFLDSPMAVNATHIYYDHREDHDLAEGELSGRHSVLKGPNVHLSSTTEQSKRLAHIKGPAVIISSAGMMTGGRILHHLKQRLPDPANTILLGGYMAAGTRGRSIQDGNPTIRIHGGDVPNRAAVAHVSGLSGHAGKSELLRWLRPLPDPRQVYLTHGEIESAESLAETLRQTRHWQVKIPKLGERVEL